MEESQKKRKKNMEMGIILSYKGKFDYLVQFYKSKCENLNDFPTKYKLLKIEPEEIEIETK